jgi:hypothetical protein
MKSTKIIYWIVTGFIVLLEGVMPALTFNTDLAKQGIAHLGYPGYFLIQLTVFKVLGSILLILPQVPRRWKEWAYAGFTFDFISACIAHTVVDGFGGDAIFPLVALALLLISYRCYGRLKPLAATTF